MKSNPSTATTGRTTVGNSGMDVLVAPDPAKKELPVPQTTRAAKLGTPEIVSLKVIVTLLAELPDESYS